MIKTITIATLIPDTQGNRILSGAIRNRGPVPVTLNFNHDIPICDALNIREEGLEIKADLMIRDQPFKAVGHLTPAIGFKIINWSESNGSRELRIIEITEIGLCKLADKNVKPIREQLSQ